MATKSTCSSSSLDYFGPYHHHQQVQQQYGSNPHYQHPHPCVELLVTNLDQSLDQREMRRTILSIFRQYVDVMGVNVYFQSDGNMAACVKVPTVGDAQYAISKLHRAKVGYKRILISIYHHSQSSHANPNQHYNAVAIGKQKVHSLLSEVPGGKLQLFKFREMFEKRFHASLGVSELYKMKDIVTVTEDEASGRMVQLNGMNNNNNNPHWAMQQQYQQPQQQIFKEKVLPLPFEVNALPYCSQHSSMSSNNVGNEQEKQGWAEKENCTHLPTVHVSLNVLTPNVKKLVKAHLGSLPLISFLDCYKAEFGGSLQEELIIDEEGVPLEHLITCIRGVVVQQSPTTGIKNIVLWEDENGCPLPPAPSVASLQQHMIPSPLAGQLSLFSRELVDLLKAQPGCRMLFNKFIPTYHHHFGRQCRVADYGYTKLKDLFDALGNVIQVMGEGSRAIITLTHRAQIKRFTSDLLRVLKSLPKKEVTVNDLPEAFERMLNMGKPFKITDYGVCEIEDMFGLISETAVVVSGSGDDMTVSIPKREQTLDELERTQQFAQECVELLRHAPDCRLPFSKFIPSYHHHFGRQCRYSTLVLLFIPFHLT